jgi:DsbC/DsbD-like thiol-disulfide interchange protein
MRQYPQALPEMLIATETLFTPTGTASSVALPQAPVTVTLGDAPISVRTGQAFEVPVHITIRPGWHINAAKPADASLIATRVEPAAGPFRLLAAAYPAAQTVRLGFSHEPLQVYTDEVTVRLRLQALPGAEKVTALRLRVQYQACSDRACLLPVVMLLTQPVGSGAVR